MRSPTRSQVLFGAMFLIVAVGIFSMTASGQDETELNVAQWEHLALTHNGADLGGDLGTQIIRLGNQGWEMVCVTPVAKEGTTTKTIYYFKRPK